MRRYVPAASQRQPNAANSARNAPCSHCSHPTRERGPRIGPGI